jgi:AraC family transcriptional regulator
MKSFEHIADKIFVHAHYTIHYRSARRTRWGGEAGPVYAALFVLGGKLLWSADASEQAEDVARGVEIENARERYPPNKANELTEGGALLVNPGEAVRATGERAESIALTLAPAYVLDCAVRARLTRADAHISFRAHAVALDGRLFRLARDLADELAEETAGQELVVAALIEQLVVQLLRRRTNIRRSDELELSRVGLVDRRIRRAVELMHARLDRDLPLEEIAAAAHLSPFHFARLFKKLAGASPHAYLATLRAARAQTLLAETDLSIIEVGARVGYNSSSHFAKAFRQATGLSPRAFRAALVRR